MTDAQAVQQWLQVHRLLMEREAAFTDTALRAAGGEISLERLYEERKELMSLRDHCKNAYEKAFPVDARGPRH